MFYLKLGLFGWQKNRKRGMCDGFTPSRPFLSLCHTHTHTHTHTDKHTHTPLLHQQLLDSTEHLVSGFSLSATLPVFTHTHTHTHTHPYTHTPSHTHTHPPLHQITRRPDQNECSLMINYDHKVQAHTHTHLNA